VVRLNEKNIVKFRNTKSWLEEINSNIGVEKGCPFSPTIFGIYIGKLDVSLKKIGCVNPTLASIVILHFYVGDIVFMVRTPYDLEKQLKILKNFYSSTDITFNTNKMKAIMFKSKKITYANFMYDNHNLKEATSYKYLIINLHHKLN
jgi:hypothetical protein